VNPLDVEGVRAGVQPLLDEFLAERGRILIDASIDTDPMLTAVTDLLRGGKRLRPAFCYWGWRAAGADDCPGIRQASASLELLQACALIHDDVMDGSDTRRGQPSVHRRFAALHRGSEWLGSPEAFGVGAAILVGDLCLSWADEMLLTSALPDDALRRGKAVYDEMRTELMAGQYLDLLEQAHGGGSRARAMRVVRYKSAKYTIERPLHLGASLAGGSAVLSAGLSAYGLPLGEAFQLRDDVLGVFGDPDVTGKPAGDDLREGKRTVLIATAMERASSAQAESLRSGLGDPGLGADGVTELRAIIEDTGARAETEAAIDSLLTSALDALHRMSLPEPTASVLEGLAFAATRRSL
jgi:geranylgeranyl diphosphate synthase type I